MQGDEIGLGKQGIKVSLFNAHFNRAIGCEERVKGHDLHSQTQRTAGNNRSDIARTDQAQRLAGNFNAHEIIFRPFARLRLRIRLWQLPRKREHQGDGVFGGRNRVTKGRVHDDHTLGRCIRDIDIVDADARAANHLQVGGGIQYLFRDLGR